MRSTNGGSSWSNLQLSIYDIKGLHFTDQNHGTYISQRAWSKTTDGGLTWSTENIFSTYNSDVSFPDDSLIFTLENYGTVHMHKSTNAGLTWYNYDIVSPSQPSTISFIDQNNGYYGCYGGEVFRTTDGGTTWILQNVIVNKPLTSITYFDANIRDVKSSQTERKYNVFIELLIKIFLLKIIL